MSIYEQLRENYVRGSEYWLQIKSDDLLEAVSRLQTDFNDLMLMNITCVDNLPDHTRFSVIYHFLSLKENYRIFLKIALQENETIKTISTIFPNSIWYEREVWDMYGVLFEGNSDMRRILTDYGFVGHPMRKDFPLTGYTEISYRHNKGVIYQKVQLAQDFRTYDAQSHWNRLPGDEKADINKNMG